MDRNRVRNYKSGASKRRKLKENDMKSSEELTKMKRMEQYFNKNTSNDNNNINEDEPCDTSSDEVSNLMEIEVSSDQLNNNNSVGSHEDNVDTDVFVDANNINMTSDMDDIGKWTLKSSDQMLEYWIQRGSSLVRNCDKDLFDKYSVKQHRKGMEYIRKCSEGLFVKQNVEVALRIYLVMMVSNCSGERSFSKLNLIKDRLRSSMKQERLVHLSLMSIESDILRELNYDDLINTFAASKARKESI